MSLADFQKHLAGGGTQHDAPAWTAPFFERIAASKALKVDWPHPRLRAYQSAGVQQMLRTPRCLLADEMGLGKTVQAITLMSACTRGRILVAAPASLRGVWEDEIARWASDPAAWTIVSYAKATRRAKALQRQRWQGLVCDEAHHLKSLTSKRTRLFCGRWVKSKNAWIIPPWVAGIPRVAYLTGTPLLNCPADLIPVLGACGILQVLGGRFGFSERYCNGRYTSEGWTEKGARHLEELQALLRASIMTRREKRHVLAELPDKTRICAPLPVVWQPSEEERSLIQWATGRPLEEVVQRLTVGGLDYDTIASVRREQAEAKVDAALAYILDLLQGGARPLVVFGHHRDALQLLFAGLLTRGNRVALIQGGVAESARRSIVSDFQAGKLDVLVASIRAAGTGLTLTRADTAVMFEADWTPAINAQAEDRLHRIGQRNAVTIHYLVVDDTLDAYILRKQLKKARIANKTLNIEENV